MERFRDKNSSHRRPSGSAVRRGRIDNEVTRRRSGRITVNPSCPGVVKRACSACPTVVRRGYCWFLPRPHPSIKLFFAYNILKGPLSVRSCSTCLVTSVMSCSTCLGAAFFWYIRCNSRPVFRARPPRTPFFHA